MKIQEQLLTEVKLGKIVEEDGVYYLVEVDKDGFEVDKDGFEIDKFDVRELCEPYLNKTHIQFLIKYQKDL